MDPTTLLILIGVCIVLLIAVVLAGSVFWVAMLIDALKSDMDSGEKLVWVLVIVFTHVLGAGVYYYAVKRAR